MKKADLTVTGKQRFPRQHLVIAGALAVGIGFSISFLPADKTEQPNNTTVSAQQTDDQTATVASNATSTSQDQKASTVQIATPQKTDKSSVKPALKTKIDTATQTDKPIHVELGIDNPDDVMLPVSVSQPSALTTPKPINNQIQPKPVPQVVNQGQGSWFTIKVNPGDTLSTIFSRHGLGVSKLYSLINSGPEGKSLADIRPGQSLEVYTFKGKLEKVRFVRNKLESILFTATTDSYHAEKIKLKPNVRAKVVSGKINHSLFLAGRKAGLSHKMTMQLANIFAWDVDFALDIRKGDSFKVVYEEKYLEGEKIGEGNILAAEFNNRGEAFTAINYTDSDGANDFYSPEGRSMRKAFIRTPVEFSRISSRFSLGRKHPVLNRIRAHKGVDYAAPRGTPIRAAGKGKVIFAGRKGGYGKVVILQHGEQYSTLYAHMNRIGKGIRVGLRVKQGDVIGAVGSTGLATGPHLHYEFRVSGVHKDPLKVKLPKAMPIARKELANFKQQAKSMLSLLKNAENTAIALKQE
ncbi:peptidoglycan DD-metalloendopeptidase family protein [Zooshikella harenae]|nr:peptidoglycan DD-metalloendopeptidase family protein [Zooshikella harenae]